MVLLGRRNECEVLDRVLNAARSGRGGTIVIHGSLELASPRCWVTRWTSATEFQVLGAVGNEAEKELAFAAAQQLCAPNLAALERLPVPQRDALGVAFGHVDGSAPDRLFVGLALLGLLSQLAATAPVLCIIDDAQWLDREPAQVFAIVARRLGPEHIVFLFGARGVPSDLNGLEGLPVEGLGPADARVRRHVVVGMQRSAGDNSGGGPSGSAGSFDQLNTKQGQVAGSHVQRTWSAGRHRTQHGGWAWLRATHPAWAHVVPMSSRKAIVLSIIWQFA